MTTLGLASEFLYPLLNVPNFQEMLDVYPLLPNSMAEELGQLMLSCPCPAVPISLGFTGMNQFLFTQVFEFLTIEKLTTMMLHLTTMNSLRVKDLISPKSCAERHLRGFLRICIFLWRTKGGMGILPEAFGFWWGCSVC